jgi:signal transduction histidine kinase
MGTRLDGAGRDRSTWLALGFLLLGVVAPTACVIWFMNEAARAQAEAAKQSVAEAYRGQLRFIRDRVDAYWESRANTLEQSAGAGSAADFARNVKAGAADSFIYLKRDGSIAYPQPTTAGATEPAADWPDWRAAQAFDQKRNRLGAIGAWTAIAKSYNDPSLAARAAQAEIRWLVSEKEAAIRAIAEYFGGGKISRGTDLQGRLIAADEQLLALHLMQPRDSRRATVTRRLSAMLNDYDNTAMPAAQRLFLMDEVRALSPNTAFPTYNAERLAAQFVEAGEVHAGGSGLRTTAVPELWKLTAKSGRVIALYRTDAVLTAIGTLLDNNGSKSVKFTAVPPGAGSTGEAIAAGAMLPGWQLSLAVVDTRMMEEAARTRMATYLWVGYLVVGMMAITGLVAGQSFRKQMRLARLKTDLVGAVSHELKTPLASMRLLVDSLLEDREFDSKKTRDYLQLIAGENLRLSRLVENFLTFSRIERNRQRLEFQEIEPANVVDSVSGIVRERFQGSGCEFSVNVETGLPPIHADPDALLSALLNLLDNAYKYTPSDKRIRLRAYGQSGQVVFAVEDNGMGIAAREQKKIFRRFYQVDRRLARESGGCGLGLSIVDSIVRAHGGSVRVTSQLGSGSTFRLCLPCGKTP